MSLRKVASRLGKKEKEKEKHFVLLKVEHNLLTEFNHRIELGPIKRLQENFFCIWRRNFCFFRMKWADSKGIIFICQLVK